MNQRQLLLFGYLGLTGSILVGIGEFLVHYNPISYTDNEIPYGYMLHVSKENMTLGHFLMVGFVPLYFAGYWHIYHALKKGSPLLASAVLLLGIYAFTIGGIWVGSRAQMGYMIHEQIASGQAHLFESLVDSYTYHLENLVNVLRVLILLISGCFVAAILKGNTMYPKWMICFNPILLLGIVFGLFLILPGIGKYLVPSAMNVAHFVLFSFSIYSISKNPSFNSHST